MNIKPYPLENTVDKIIKNSSNISWKPTGVNRDTYLDIAEPIVRMAAEWVNDKGAVIDPIINKEWAQTSSRFASSAAILIKYGRCRDLLDKTCRVMLSACRKMANGEAKSMSPNFWTRELVTADMCLDGIAPRELQAKWRADLKKFVPEKTYAYVDPTHGEKLKEFHNWAIYSAGGEALRELAGLTPEHKDFLYGKDFFDIYMEPQMTHMTEYGMYRDPGDPFTYDITTRLQFAMPLAFGLESKIQNQLSEFLRRGGLTMLLFVSPEGYAPYGGRSSQFHFQEAIISCLSELEARRYAQNNPELAGAFKRQAHISALSIKRWITGMEPIRHIKNAFPPKTSHGIDRYGQYSVYSLLCSSFMGMAALLADENIKEAITPSEIGGYVLELSPAFNKVFANAAGTYIEIDTKADTHYDSTGLGRVLFKGAPMEMILGMPFTEHATYRYAEDESTSRSTSLSCVWKSGDSQISLAEQSEELQSTVKIISTSPEAVKFSIEYKIQQPAGELLENYELSKNKLVCTSRAKISGKPAESIIYRVPVIVTDGKATSEITLTEGKLSGKYRDSEWAVEWDKSKVKAEWEKDYQSNRNGRYRILQLHAAGDTVAVTITKIK